ncbi:Ribonuclease H-like domain containing protein [Forsythia ovata]|uniref:Ribonuclease H-like domain containing protein n=1 Tax=Forsythia ovata TaxID=205694 RepID=A0ABD1WK97_9LAMI
MRDVTACDVDDFNGIGVVIQDHSGSVLAASSQPAYVCFSPKVAASLALRYGLQLAKNHGFRVGITETSAQRVTSFSFKRDDEEDTNNGEKIGIQQRVNQVRRE